MPLLEFAWYFAPGFVNEVKLPDCAFSYKAPSGVIPDNHAVVVVNYSSAFVVDSVWEIRELTPSECFEVEAPLELFELFQTNQLSH